MIIHNTTDEEVENIIDSMKSKPSSGEDDTPSKLIKHCKNELTSPLTILINKSLHEGTFPSSLKIAKVYPKYKSGQNTEAANYRPISLISCFSKILERVVLSRLTEHLQHYNLLTPRQHGFIKNRSTTTAVVQLIEGIIDKLEQGYLITSIMLDFSKAFACLNHKLIIEKLRTLGINGKEANWFTSYLSGRKQRVELRYTDSHTNLKVKSEALPMTRGVPQGSVLGPVLYILLANDFPQYLEEFCETVMFADDTALLVASKNTEELEINSYTAYNMAKQYCFQNDLVLNESKSYQLIYTTRQNEHQGLPELTTTNSNKYLGIILDNNLSWTPHVTQLCKKLNAGLYAMRRMKQISDKKTTLTAYFSLFETHLRYGLLVWGGTSTTNLQRVLIIQKRAIRIIKGLKPQETCREAFKEYNILTVTALYILEVILHAVKTGKARLGDQHTHNTRHRHDFTLDTHHLSIFEKKPSYQGAVLYNCLPENLKRLPEKNLKQGITNWLLDRTTYIQFRSFWTGKPNIEEGHIYSLHS
uniref:Reverse transcriptase domain-containing protein n=1 Tax=Graphocephala atropunctata TaxID=36148 RepID=A0A1B6K8M1_9HEMI